MRDRNINNLQKFCIKARQERCRNCIGIVYNKDTYLYYGRDNGIMKVMFIIPPHDISRISPVEEELRNLYKELFDKDIYKYAYITRCIKCNIKDDDKIVEAFKNCKQHIFNEICFHTPSVVFVVGNKYSFIKEEFEYIFPYAKFVILPSPLTKNINISAYNKLKELLKQYVIL